MWYRIWMLPRLNVQRANNSSIGSGIAWPRVVVHPIISVLLELLLGLLLVNFASSTHQIQLVAILLCLLIWRQLARNIHRLRKVNRWLAYLILVQVLVLLIHHPALLLPVPLNLIPEARWPIGLATSSAMLFLATRSKLMLELLGRRGLVQGLARLFGQGLLEFSTLLKVRVLLIHSLRKQLRLRIRSRLRRWTQIKGRRHLHSLQQLIAWRWLAQRVLLLLLLIRQPRLALHLLNPILPQTLADKGSAAISVFLLGDVVVRAAEVIDVFGGVGGLVVGGVLFFLLLLIKLARNALSLLQEVLTLTRSTLPCCSRAILLPYGCFLLFTLRTFLICVILRNFLTFGIRVVLEWLLLLDIIQIHLRNQKSGIPIASVALILSFPAFHSITLRRRTLFLQIWHDAVLFEVVYV